MDCYILQAILLMIILLNKIAFICYHYEVWTWYDFDEIFKFEDFDFDNILKNH